MIRLIFYLIIFYLMAPSSRIYADRITDAIPSNARARGMAWTGINTLDDSYAIFYNPANLASKKIKTHFELLNFQLESNVGAVNAFGKDGSTPQDIGKISAYLQANPGKWGGYRFSVYPNFTSRFISFGVLYESQNNAKYESANPPLFTSSRMLQSGFKRVRPTFAISHRMYGGIFRIGYSLGIEYLGVSTASVDSPELKTLSWTTGLHEGVGIIHTLGTTLTLPFSHTPSFSFVTRNIGQTKYFSGDLNRTDKMSFDGSASYSTHISRWYEMKVAVDYRDIFNTTKTNFMRRFFTGGEFVFFRGLNFRGGLSQGYPAFGFGFGTRGTRLDFSWYSQEMADGYRTERDQRFVFQLTMGFFGKIK